MSFPSPYSATVPTFWLRSDYFYKDLGTTLCTTTGDQIEQATDISGNGNNFTQTTSGNRPTFTTNALGGYPSSTFSSANSQYLTSNLATQLLTVIVVGRVSSASVSYQEFISQRAAAGNDVLFLQPFVNESPMGQQGYVLDHTSTYRGFKTGCGYGGQYYMMGLRTDASTEMQLEVNGGVVGSTTFSGGLASCSGPTLVGCGSSGTTPANFLQGDILEVLGFSTRLSDAEIAQVYLALRNRYWPAVSPAAFNFPIFSYGVPGGNGGQNSGYQEYARFFTSTNGSSLTELPFSASPNTPGGVFRDPSMIRVNGTYFLVASNFTSVGSSGTYGPNSTIEVWKSDRMNGPFQWVASPSLSGIVSGGSPQFGAGAVFYDPIGKSIGVPVSGNRGDGTNTAGYITASDNSLANWSSAQTIGGVLSADPYAGDIALWYNSGTYWLFYVSFGGTEIVRIMSSLSPWTGYTMSNASPFGTGNNGKIEAPRVRPNGSTMTLYLGGYGETPVGFYFATSSNLAFGSATWSAPVQTDAQTPVIHNGAPYIPGLDPPVLGSPLNQSFGPGYSQGAQIPTIMGPWGYVAGYASAVAPTSPEIVQDPTGDTNGTGTGVAGVVMPTAVTAGNPIIVVIGVDTNRSPTLTDTVGTTYTLRQSINSGSGLRVEIWTGPAGGSGGNVVTANYGATLNDVAMSAIEIKNMAGWSYDTGNTASGTSNTFTTGSFTPTGANEVVISACATTAFNALLAPGSGGASSVATHNDNPNNNGTTHLQIGWQYNLAAPAGAQTAGFGSSVSALYAVAAVVLKT